MTLARFLVVPLLAIPACVAPSESLGQGESSSGTPGSATQGEGTGSEETASGSATSGQTGTATAPGDSSGMDSSGMDTTGEACGPNPCAACGPGCATANACVDGQWVCDCSCALMCDLAELACQEATGETEPVDCGEVTFADTDADWQQAHDCALNNAALTVAFKLVAAEPSDDSLPRSAHIGNEGVQYLLERLYQDIGGSQPPDGPVYRQVCTALAAAPGCTPGIGNLCLECVDPTPNDVVCEPDM